MYNRYLRNDQGIYTCIPQEETHRAPRQAAPPPQEAPPPQPCVPPPKSEERGSEERRELFSFLDRMLEKLHLQDLDSADLMLLLLLFFLFEEKADDELLIALGLLLIL